MTHVIWDWNGTLLDDLPVTVAAASAALEPLGCAPIDAGVYRDHYTRPVKLFYERVLGRGLTEVEWQRCDEVWRSTYTRMMADARLAADALDALERIHHHPRAEQSLLSMWWHDSLHGIARRYGIEGYMRRIDGNDGRSGDRKAALMGRHLDALGRSGAAVVVIGDSVDDAEAARANGVRCVLVDSGTHHRHELDGTGHPVASSLLEALALAGV